MRKCLAPYEKKDIKLQKATDNAHTKYNHGFQ